MKKTIYHGSKYIIDSPELKTGKKTNDFGQGFYCTEDIELAKEWACQKNLDGFVNTYELDMDGLKVLDLLDGNYNVLNWITLLLENRIFPLNNPTLMRTRDYLIKNFYVDTTGYDVIIGYRADDSYFSYAKSWVSNSLTVNDLQSALYLGELGEQVVLKSDKAFAGLKFVEAKPVMCGEYYPKYIARDERARSSFRKMQDKKSFNKNDIFAMDIMRGEMKADDARIQQFICRRCDK